eukprot:3015606-Rhodomonas_salina.1
MSAVRESAKRLVRRIESTNCTPTTMIMCVDTIASKSRPILLWILTSSSSNDSMIAIVSIVATPCTHLSASARALVLLLLVVLLVKQEQCDDVRLSVSCSNSSTA